MKYKENQKIALAKVLSDLIQSDGLVSQGEIDYLHQIYEVIGIQPSQAKKAMGIPLSAAVERLIALGDAEKKAALKILLQLSFSDDDFAKDESLLITALITVIGIDLPEMCSIKARLVSIPNLTFDTRNAILYVESEYNEKVNHAIQESYDDICRLLNKHHREFFYLPKVLAETQQKKDTFCDALSYLEPSLSSEQIDIIGESLSEIDTAALSKEIFLNYLNINGFKMEKPAFFLKIYSQRSSHYQDFLILEIDDDPLETLKAFYRLKDRLPKIDIKGENPKEKCFFEKLEFTHSEQQKGEVQYTGFHKVIIDTLLRHNGAQGASRLYIAANGNLYLTDRNNIQVTMSSLCKALYILFLLHEEGIQLNYLVDYKNELYRIYRQTSDYLDDVLLHKAVDNLTDALGNTLNANLSRIKKAFISILGEDASNYLIRGEKGEKKTISLDRKLVVFEDKSLFK